MMVLAAALLVPPYVHGQEEPGSELSVYLITMGPGDQVWEKFGHNAIWIHDPVRGTDQAYNYGMFDFAQPNFLHRFVQGRMLYWMEGFNAHATIEHYRQANRSVWAQELNLTPAQKHELDQFLRWNELPENRFYRYDYYRDNCSTRIRDALDRVLGGALRGTAGAASGSTYRSHTRRLTAGEVPVYTGLLAGLGPASDRPISVWEEMFLPMQLRDHVRHVTTRDAAGRTVPLLTSEHQLVEASRPPERAEPPRDLWGYLLAGLALGGVFALLGQAGRRWRGARWGLAGLGTLWTLLAGIGGLILAGLWAFTDHEIAYRNENLFQLSPLALPLAVLIPALALGIGGRWAARPAWWLMLAVVASSLLGLVLKVLPGMYQVNGGIIALALPAHLGLAWAVWRLHQEKTRPV